MPDDQDFPEDEFPPGEADDVSGLASVVHVDRHEDVAAVCGRVDTAPTYAVVIHAPQGNRQLSTELGIRRLRRHAEDSGRVVAIATTNVNLAARARQAGIPVARRPEYVRWESGGHRVVRLARWSLVLPSLGRYVQLAVILGVAVAFVGALLTLAPSGQVDAYPPTETLSANVVITASEEIEQPDLETLQVPAREVTAKRTLTFAVRTTGKTTVTTGPAKVALAITNPGTAAVTVPAGSIVATATGIEFAIDAETVVAAGKSAAAAATAVSNGAEGAVAAAAITVWADARFKALTVTNAAAAVVPTAQVAAIAPADLAALKELVHSSQASEAVKKIVVEARPRDAVFLETASVTVVEGDASGVAGDPGEIVFMDASLTVTALAILQETLEVVARHVLREDAAGEFIPGSVTAVENGARRAAADGGTLTASFDVSGEFARGLSMADIRAAVKGKSPGSAESTLASRYGIQRADVKVTPGWAPWLPRFAFRIGVDLRSEKAGTPEQGAPTDGSTTTPAATAGTTPTAAPRP
ncbi:MAG: hypothetical protein HY875_12115 [Chloroflexi bacterium]|nr:hypothetical protein [Chloroflexota bacterium]